MVRDMFAASNPGVTINIAPLLSLSADQHSKFMQKRRTPQVFSLHLDAYRTTSQQKEICALLLRVASHGSISTFVVVFSSTQALTDNPIYITMLHSLLNMKLVLVCIDEVHLFVQFGLWFRSEFVRLKSVLFDHHDRFGEKRIFPCALPRCKVGTGHQAHVMARGTTPLELQALIPL